MTKSRVSVGLKTLGIAFGAVVAIMGFNQAASAQIAPINAKAFERGSERVFSTKKSASKAHASKKRYSSKRSRGKYASKRSGRKYASKSHRSNRVARRGNVGNKGALMATLARVKPAGLPLKLAAAVITQESGWRVNARGSSGEIGLMQLMPATARQYGAGNIHNPTENMRVGTRVLHDCYRRAGGNVAATIGCYNRGPGLMWSWNGRSITRRYVSNVHRYMGRS